MAEVDFWPQLFKKVDSAIHQIDLYTVDNAILLVSLILLKINLMDTGSPIQSLNNWGLVHTYFG